MSTVLRKAVPFWIRLRTHCWKVKESTLSRQAKSLSGWFQNQCMDDLCVLF